jgi:tripartite-type tricarboxylate transporter receptor subunit TctC
MARHLSAIAVRGSENRVGVRTVSIEPTGSKKVKMIFLVALVYLSLGAEAALSQAPFYQDKTISVVLGGPPAGSADMRTKAVTTILRKHIPGNPTIIVQYMAAGGRSAGRQSCL